MTNLKMNLFCEKLESVQYKAALAITGAEQGASRDKIYQELGLESLESKRWYKRLSFMFKNVKQTPEQETTVYPLSTAEQIVSSTLFYLLH